MNRSDDDELRLCGNHHDDLRQRQGEDQQPVTSSLRLSLTRTHAYGDDHNDGHEVPPELLQLEEYIGPGSHHLVKAQ